jgi:TolB protein
MRAVTKVARNIALAILGTASGALVSPAVASAVTPSLSSPAASAVTPALSSPVAYVRGGDVYVSKGAAETRLTTGGGYSRPRWSPDGRQLAFLKNGQLWTMRADGSAKRRLTTRAASGPSWSPDGRTIAFASLSCTGGPGVYSISTTAAGAQPKVLFPSSCRTEALPPEPSVATATPTGDLNDRLRNDNAVAWSPDGAKVAFRGGECESIYNACLSVGTVATGAEQTLAAYGGGSLETSGFAVVPSWRADGAKLAWTAYQVGEVPAENQPVHVVEYDTVTGAERTVGHTLDRELAYIDATHGVATGQNQGGSWVMVVNLATGVRTAFHAGSQPSAQPLTS